MSRSLDAIRRPEHGGIGILGLLREAAGRNAVGGGIGVGVHGGGPFVDNDPAVSKLAVDEELRLLRTWPGK